LNQGGESWIAEKLATWERTFPLHDLLTKQLPDFDEEGMAVYFATKNPEIKVDKLTHLALGIFWKASVHSWSGTRKDPRIELGPYSDGIRTWLRGESEFPRHIYLVAVLSRPQRAQITMVDPYEAIRQEWRSFFFHIPGLLFVLNVGKTVDETMQYLCIQNNPAHPVNISDKLTDQFEQLFVENFRQARKTKPFLRLMDKIGHERKQTRDG
jgi:hypothetical protein